MADLMQHVKELSQNIGVRAPASDQETKAADYIEGQFINLGLNPKRESFKTVTSVFSPLLLINLLFVGAVLLFLIHPWLGLVLAGLDLLVLVLESNTFPILSSRISKKGSQNIRAVVEARSKAIRRVVLSAHYDSSTSPIFVRSLRRYLLMELYTIIGIFSLLLLGTILPFIRSSVGIVALLFSVCLLGIIVFQSYFKDHQKYTPGTYDNATGVSVLLEVSRILAKNPLTLTSVDLLATGCKEAGSVGMIHFLKTHLISKDTVFINLAPLADGSVTMTTREGIIGGKDSSTTILESAQEIADEKGLNIEFRPFKMQTTDATAALMRGFAASTIIGLDDKGLIRNTNLNKGIEENVKLENLENAKALILGILRKIDQ